MFPANDLEGSPHTFTGFVKIDGHYDIHVCGNGLKYITVS
jgi:hypothetical protein